MELRTLSYFVAVAEAGTISAAAMEVHVGQPSLSRQLAGLERSLGVDLFIRDRGRLRMSSAGRELLPLARDLLARAEAIRTAAGLHAHGRLDRVTIAAPTTTLTDIVSPFLTTLRPDDPIPELMDARGLVAGDLLARGADLVITTGRPGPPAHSIALTALPVWAYLPPGHACEGRTALPLSELIAEPLLALSTGHAARRVLDAAVTAAGMEPPRITEAGNGTVAQALAAAGRGIAVLSDDPRFGLARTAVTGRGGRLSVRLHCSWAGDHPAQTLLAGLAHRIATYVEEFYGESPTTQEA